MRIVIPILLGLAACAPIDPADECGAAGLAEFVGKPADTLPPRAGPVRLIAPGSPVTLDFLPDRLNADLDEAGTITRLWCG